MTALQTRIQALTLTGVASASVLVRWTPFFGDVGNASDKAIADPAILICPVGQEQILLATNRREDHGYPVLIAFADQTQVVKHSTAMVANMSRNLLWRETVIRSLLMVNQTPLTLVSPVVTFHRAQVEPGPIVDWQRFKLNETYTGYIVARFFTRDDRT